MFSKGGHSSMIPDRPIRESCPPFSRGFPAADVELLAALVQALNQVEDVKPPIDAVHVTLSIRTYKHRPQKGDSDRVGRHELLPWTSSPASYFDLKAFCCFFPQAIPVEEPIVGPQRYRHLAGLPSWAWPWLSSIHR